MGKFRWREDNQGKGLPQPLAFRGCAENEIKRCLFFSHRDLKAKLYVLHRLFGVYGKATSYYGMTTGIKV
jgi:hypothetical protein